MQLLHHSVPGLGEPSFAWATVVTTAKFYVLAFDMPFHVSHFDFSNMVLVESLSSLRIVQVTLYLDATNQ